MPRVVGTIQIVLSLVIIITLAVGCGGAPSTSTPGSITTPPASEYPADIIGRVTIAETVNAKYQRGSQAGKTMEMTPLEGKIYWVVDISVKNKAYENAVTAIYEHWKIVVDDMVYDAQQIGPFGIQSAYPMNVPTGEMGETIIRFPVPDTLKVSSAKLCYQGQKPFSYGKLISGDKVAVYDWDLKKAVTEELAKTTKTIYDWEFKLNSVTIKSTSVNVNITITSHHSGIKTYTSRGIGSLSGKDGDGELVLVDQYGGLFVYRTEEEPFYMGQYYPQDSKTGNLKFTVNPKSGKIELWSFSSLGRTFATYNQYKLFDLGEIK